MFEIGESLRKARERQGLELSDVERATRVGSRYLAALEEERFDRLPAPAYARAFLRGYADFLGLDAKLFVEEFDSRFAEPDPLPPAPDRPLALPVVALWAVAVLAAAGVVVVVSILAFGSPGGKHRRSTASPLPFSKPVSRPPAPPPPATHQPLRPPARAVVSLVLTASRGNCWLSVHVGSSTGQPLYQGILSSGHSLRFLRAILWIRIGAPWNLTARLNGTPVTNLPVRTGNVLVTHTGVHPA